MPTYSNAIADATPDPQKPVATPPRRPRAKEFWEAEPGDPGTEGWTDNPEDPTGPQIGNPAAPTPPPVAAPPKPAPPQPPCAALPGLSALGAGSRDARPSATVANTHLPHRLETR